MVDALASELLDLMTVRSLEWREAAHIKRLEEVGGMGWHAESDDLVLCAVLVELRRGVAAMAVEDKKPVDSTRTRRGMSVKVLYPLYAELICRPAVVADCENPVWREVVVPASLVLLTRQDHERWKTLARRVDTLNRGSPLSITWLYDSSATYCV